MTKILFQIVLKKKNMFLEKHKAGKVTGLPQSVLSDVLGRSGKSHGFKLGLVDALDVTVTCTQPDIIFVKRYI